MANKILGVNAELKWIEHLMGVFDTGEDSLTLKEIRDEFLRKFSIPKRFPLLNNDFGIIRLLPLILIKEIYKRKGKIYSEDIKKIEIIRHAIAHYNFDYDENGYSFNANQGSTKMSYNEFVGFLHRIENEFHEKSPIDKDSGRNE